MIGIYGYFHIDILAAKNEGGCVYSRYVLYAVGSGLGGVLFGWNMIRNSVIRRIPKPIKMAV